MISLNMGNSVITFSSKTRYNTRITLWEVYHMILSDIDIRMCIGEEPALIKRFCEEHLQGTSYDLSMSNKIR